MDGRAGRSGPYLAVALVAAWAPAVWIQLDGELQREGIDLERSVRGPANRFLALMLSKLVDRLALIESDDERKEILHLLEWPKVAARRTIEQQDAQAREAMMAFGIVPPVGAGPGEAFVAEQE